MLSKLQVSRLLQARTRRGYASLKALNANTPLVPPGQWHTAPPEIKLIAAELLEQDAAFKPVDAKG